MCLSGSCQKAYTELTGRNLVADNLVWRISADAKGRIERWSLKSVEAIVSKISAAVRAARPGIPISVSSHADYEPLRVEGADSIS